ACSKPAEKAAEAAAETATEAAATATDAAQTAAAAAAAASKAASAAAARPASLGMGSGSAAAGKRVTAGSDCISGGASACAWLGGAHNAVSTASKPVSRHEGRGDSGWRWW
ncbi:MAG: hypothetical protein CFE45_02990, partial [Burkholderiales bacterium PBB5]